MVSRGNAFCCCCHNLVVVSELISFNAACFDWRRFADGTVSSTCLRSVCVCVCVCVYSHSLSAPRCMCHTSSYLSCGSLTREYRATFHIVFSSHWLVGSSVVRLIILPSHSIGSSVVRHSTPEPLVVGSSVNLRLIILLSHSFHILTFPDRHSFYDLPWLASRRWELQKWPGCILSLVLIVYLCGLYYL